MVAGLTRTLMCSAAMLGSGAVANAQTIPASTPGQAGQLSDSQPTPPSDSSTQSPGPDSGEIIVTAQKRAQNVQNVPLAVQVLTGEQLQANGVRDFADLNRTAPSLVVKPAENPVNASVSIRGVGTFAFSIGVEPSVAVVVDDVPIAFQARAFADLVDVERIEVLRGPQSTLYGKSASAGLISIVTPRPSSKLTAKFSGFGTTDSEYGGNAVISGPITPTLGFRSTANYDKFQGNVRNLTTGNKVNGRRIFSTRNKLTWTPGSRTTVTAALDYIDGDTTIGRPFVRVGPGALLRGNPAYPQSVWAPGITVGPDNRDVDNNYTSGTRYHDFAQSLRGSFDLGGPSLVSITSHDKFKLTDTLDQDESPIPTIDNRQFGNFKSEQFTQELRLVSPGTDRFRYTLGAFYAAVDYSRDFTRGPVYAQARWYATSKTRQADVFGQLEFDIVPGTTVIGGLRRGHEKIRYSFEDIRNGDAFFSGQASENFTTYKAGLQQHLGPNVMLFATYSTGHKGQTYDLSTGFNANRALAGPVRPETSRDWEVGARTQFFDRHLTLNVTAFDTHYRNFQAQGIETFPDGSVNYRLTNVGRLRTRGIEGEATVRVARSLSLGAGVTYLDAKITDFPDAQCFPAQTLAQGCNPAAGGNPAFQNLSGQRPPQAPKWKLNGTLDYAHDLGSLPFQGVVQGAAVYQGRVNYSLNQDPETAQGGYTIVNLSAGIRSHDRGYSVMLFVNNLLDKQYYQNLADSRGNYANVLATQAYLPRDFRRYAGIRGSVSF